MQTSTLDGLENYALHHFGGGEEAGQHEVQVDHAAAHISMVEDVPSQLILSDHNFLLHEAPSEQSSQSSSFEYTTIEERLDSSSQVLAPELQGNSSGVGTLSSQMSVVGHDLRNFEHQEQHQDDNAVMIDVAIDESFAPEPGQGPMTELDSPLLLTPEDSSSPPFPSGGYQRTHLPLGVETNEIMGDVVAQMETKFRKHADGTDRIEVDGTCER